MSNAPPQAHPNWMLTATPKGWHYTSHPIWMRLKLCIVKWKHCPAFT
ncbi:MAG: hypothetical protein P8H62_01840 [Henriciella sp.]|nr:hypothetical protein [Henriciella sp.]